MHVINHRLKTTMKRLQSWSKGLFSGHKQQLIMALDVILHLDVAQESRVLTNEERCLRSSLKRRDVGLAMLKRSCKRQPSIMTCLREGDAKTKLFHLRVNYGHRKNHIQMLKRNVGWVTNHVGKQSLIHNHFVQVLGCLTSRPLDYNSAVIDSTLEDLEILASPSRKRKLRQLLRICLWTKPRGLMVS